MLSLQNAKPHQNAIRQSNGARRDGRKKKKPKWIVGEVNKTRETSMVKRRSERLLGEILHFKVSWIVLFESTFEVPKGLKPFNQELEGEGTESEGTKNNTLDQQGNMTREVKQNILGQEIEAVKLVWRGRGYKQDALT